MAWTSVIETGEFVNTPQGSGRVRRISEAQASAQVEIDGQLYEIPLTDITKEGVKPGEQPGQPEGGESPKPNPGQIPKGVKPWNAAKGKRVQTKDGGKKHGVIEEVTQRAVKGKFDDGKKFSFPKREVERHLDFETGEQPGKNEGERKNGQEQPEQKQEQQKPEDKPVEQQAQDAGDTLYGLLKLKDHLEKRIDEGVDGELKELREQVKKSQQLEVKVGDKVNKVEGLRHKQLEQLINYSALRMNTLLVGMAGTGKTHAAEQVANALGLDFYAISVGAQTSQSQIIGFIHANGGYVRTHFRDAYEHGGVFLMDEIDAGNANVLITINAALSNGYMSFPDAMVRKHEDFVFIASANTFGNGANRQYVGRNQLDAATLDRFAIIEWHIDDDLEESLTVGINGKAWYMSVRAARDYVAEKNIRALISPRATQKGSKLLHVGQDLTEVINAVLLGSVPEDKKADVTHVATTIFLKFASEVKSQLPKAINPEVSDLVRGTEVPF